MRNVLALALVLSLPSFTAVAEEAAAPAEAPVAAEADRPAWQPIPTSDEQVLWGIALSGHGQFVPGFMLSPFLQQFTTLTSGGFGISGVRRKGTLDIVLTLDFTLFTPPDGNFLGSGKDATVYTHFTQFKGLNVLALDVAFYWTYDLASWIAIQIGGGVGLGIVFGDIFVINSKVGCDASTAGDPNKCYAHSEDVDSTGQKIGDIKPSDPDFQKKLDATTTAQVTCMKTPGNDCRDTAQHPYFHKSGDKPPVVPVVNFILGFKFKLHRHFNFNVSGGFRNGFVVGGGPEYVF